ncbi:MAG TPA: SH3 domain-containing protein [Candidatus Binatia bacterium]
MLRRQHIFLCVLVSLLSLTLGACKNKQDQVASDDLPDLSKQTRPYVTVENTRVRGGPGEQFKTIGEIKANAKVHVVGRDGDWLLIVSKKGNAPGYIEMESAKPGEGEEQEADAPRPVEGKYVTLVNTQVRSGPGLHYPAVAEIPKGMKLNVVEEEKGWLKVESKQGRKPGYVDASLARPEGKK